MLKKQNSKIPVMVWLIGTALIMVILPVISGNANPGGAPYYVYGYVYDIDGVTLLANNSVTITNVTGGQSVVVSTDGSGYYQCDVGSKWDSATGDQIRVNATDGVNSGWNTTTVDRAHSSSWCNVTLTYPTLNVLTSGTGSKDNDMFGWNVSYAGDLNGDGISDIVVGAPYNDTGGTDAGAVYIFFGKASWSSGDLDVANADIAIYGTIANGHLGWSVSGAGDVNGTYDDVIIGCPDSANGNAYIIYGWDIKQQAAGDKIIKVSDGDVTITNISGGSSGDKFGFSVSGAGDVDNSGYNDVIVGAPYNDTLNGSKADAGMAYVFFGDGTIPTSAKSADVNLTGETAGDYFGHSVSDAGDVNNDGFDDVIVGAPYNDAGGADAGKAYIFYGSSTMGDDFAIGVGGKAVANAQDPTDNTADLLGDIQDDDAIIAPPGAVTQGDNVYTVLAGGSICFIDGFDTTGMADPIASAVLHLQYGTEAGYAGTNYVRYALDSQSLQATTILPADTNAGWSTDQTFDLLGTISGLTINQISTLDIEFTNNDGPPNDDLSFDYMWITVTGKSPDANVTFTGENAGDHFGYSISNLSSVNGDSYNDVIVGAPSYGTDKGRAYIFYSNGSMSSSIDAANANVTLTGAADNDQFGYSVSSAGDMNNDGYNDTVVGAPYDDFIGSRINCGAIYVFNGSSSMLSSISAANANYTNFGENAGDNFGFTVSYGNVNGDNVDDVLVGAPYYGSGDNGKVYVLTTVLPGPNNPPNKPTGLGVQSFVSGQAGLMHITNHNPNLNWTFSDPDGNSQGGYNVSVWNGSVGGGTLMWYKNATGSGTSIVYGDGGEPASEPSFGDGYCYNLSVEVRDAEFWNSSKPDFDIMFRMNTLPPAPTGGTNLGLYEVDHTPTVSWTAGGTDAEGDTITYYVYVGTSAAPTTQEWSGAATTCDLGNTVTLSDGTTYYWRVKANDSFEDSSYAPSSDGDEFRMNTPPNPPINLGVQGYADGTSNSLNITNHTPNLNWTFSDPDAGDSQGWYNVSVWNGSVGSTLMWYKNSTGATTVEYGVGGGMTALDLADGYNYNFSVKTNDSNADEWGSLVVMMFHMNTKPDKPTNSDPPDGTDQPVSSTETVSWNTVTDNEGSIITYWWQVSKDDGGAFTSIIVQDNTTGATSSQFTTLAGSTYYWRVQANDSYENSTWGDTWSFNAISGNQPPNPPTLVSPDNNTWTNDNTPLFDWDFSDPDGDASGGFNVSIDDDVNFGSINYFVNQSTTTNVTQWLFPENTSYSTISDGTWYWRVKANDTNGVWSSWSVYYVIRIDTVAPTVTIEYNNSKTYYKDDDVIRIYANFTEADSGINESSVRITIDTSGTDVTNQAMTKTDNMHWYYDWDVPSGSDGNVNISISAQDNATNPVGGTAWDTSKYVDNTPPAVTVVAPSNGTTDVPADTAVTVTFNEDMDKGSVESAFSIEKDDGGIAVSGDFIWPADNQMKFTPSTVLDGDTKYWFNVSIVAKDLAGNPLSAMNSTYFTTSAGATATATGQTGRTNNPSITITYTTSGSPTSVKLYYTNNANASWTLAGTDTDVDGSYGWTIPSDGTYGWIAVAVGGSSTEADPPAGGTLAEKYGLILDTTPPAVSSTTPTDGFTISDVWENVAFTFSEAMNITTVTYNVQSSTIWSNTFGAEWSANNRILWLNHTTAFNDLTKYWINITAGKDLAGNIVTGSLRYLDFYVDVTAGDTTPPNSYVDTLSWYWNNIDTASITATATDINGVQCVGLWYSYSSNNVSWGGMILLSLKTTTPWTWAFSFPNGTGWYNLSTNSTDNSSNHNKEPVNFAGDVRIGYDNTPPNNPLSAVETHGAENNTWQNFVASPTFKWDYPNDNLSGVDGFYWYFGTSGTGTGANYTTLNETSVGTVGNDTYYFRIMSRDKAGNNNGYWVTMFVFRYDITLPVSIIATPAEASCFKSKPIWFNGTCSDNLSGIKKVEIKIVWKYNSSIVKDWADTNLTANYTWWNYSFTPPNEDNFTIYIRAVDNASNYQASISVNVTYDITPPATTITLVGTPGMNGWYVSEVVVNLTATDILCGVLRIENSTGMPFSTYIGNFTLSADGTYYIQYRAVDRAGNVESTQVQVVRIDKTKPEKPLLLIPGNDTWTNTSSVLFDWQNSSDTCSGVANYTLQVSKTLNFSYLDYTAVNLTATMNTSLPLNDDIYYWRVIVKDNASNSNTSEVWIVKIDTGKPPSPTLIYPVNEEISDNTPMFMWSAAADNFSGLAYYTIQVSTTFSFLPSDIVYEAKPGVNYSTPTTTIDDGTYWWRVRAVDNADNLGEWSSKPAFTINSGALTGLELQINYGANYTNSTGVVLTISVDNPPLDCCMCFSNDGVLWSDNESFSTAKIWDLTLYGGNNAEGKKTVYVRCKKSAETGVFAQSDSSIILDLTPPGAALQSPQNDTWTNSSLVEFRWKAWDNFKLSGKYHIQIVYENNYTLLHEMYLNNGTVNNDTSAYGYSLSDGRYLWRVRAEDEAFNWSDFTDYRVVKIDTQKPAGPMLYQPGNNVTVAEMNVTLGWQNLSLFDFSGIYQYELWVDTNIFHVSGESNSTTISLFDGTYYWKVRAVDIAGNIGSFSETQSFTVDRKGPKNVSFLINGDAAYTNVEQVYLSIYAENTAWMRFSNDSGNWTEWEPYTVMREWSLLWVEDNNIVNRTVYLECKSWNDVKSPLVSDSIVLDKRPPFACILNESQTINVDYFVLGWYCEYSVLRYDISTDGVDWFDVGQNTSWNFTPLRECYNIFYVRAVAFGGTPGGADSLQILVDTKKPVGVSLEINSNNGFTNSTVVELRLEAQEDISEDFASGLWKIYLWDNEGWEEIVEINISKIFDPVNITMEWSLLGADGSKTVWFKVVDRAGNEAITSATIFLDRVEPVNLSIGMSDYMNSTIISLNLSADDPGMGSGLWQMCFSEDGVVWDDWIMYGTGFVYGLKDVSDGLKTVYFRVRDRAGNENTVNGEVVLDRTKPVINVIQTPVNLTEDHFYFNITVTISEVNPKGLPLLMYRIGSESWFSENMIMVNGNTFYFNISKCWDDYKGMYINYTVSYSDMAGNTNITVMCEVIDDVVDEDLWVSDVFWEPEKVTIGEVVNITVVVHNNNESDLSDVEVVFYWRYYGLPGGCIGRVFVNLSAGGSMNVTINYSFPLTVEGYLDVKIDPDNRIPEIDKSNNVFTKPFTVWELPDLILVGVSFTPVLPVENETVFISVEVENRGGEFSKTFIVEFWIGGFVNNTFNSSLIGTAVSDPVSSSETSVISYSWKAVSGEWVVYVRVNSTGIIEKSLGNNNFSANLTVLVRGIGVVVSWVDTPRSVEPGGVLDYDIKIKNMGNVNETFDLSVDAPSGWKTTFLYEGENIVNVTLEKGEEKRLTLRIHVPDDAGEGDVNIKVIASSQSMGMVSYTENVVVKVKPKDVFQWWIVAIVAAIVTAVLVALMKTGVLVVKAKPAVKIETGYNYLIKGTDVRKAYAVFMGLTKKIPGLCITSTHPRKRRDEYKLVCSVYWLTDVTKTDEKTLHPERLDFELFKTVNDFVKAKHGVVMLDGLEYLIGVNGFERTMDFIDSIRDAVATHNGTLVVSTNPSVFKEEELGMLEKKFDKIVG